MKKEKNHGARFFIWADSKTPWHDNHPPSVYSQSGSQPGPSIPVKVTPGPALLHTCPLSKFSFSSSRLLAPPVRRITLGIALGTCCMELFTRSIVVCFSQPRNKKNKPQNVQSINGPDCKKNKIKKIKCALTMADSGPCCAGLDVPFTGSFGLSVHHPSQWQEQSERHQCKVTHGYRKARLPLSLFQNKSTLLVNVICKYPGKAV